MAEEPAADVRAAANSGQLVVAAGLLVVQEASMDWIEYYCIVIFFFFLNRKRRNLMGVGVGDSEREKNVKRLRPKYEFVFKIK